MLETSEFLGRALVEEGLIHADQLRKANALAAEACCKIDEAIETLGFLPAKKIALAKAQICESSFVDLSHFEINLENCRLIPKALAEQHLCFPLFVLDGVLTLGIEDPLNLVALDHVRQAVQAEIDVVLCETKLLRELIERAYNLASLAPDDPAAVVKGGGDAAPGEDDEAGPIVAAVNTLLADAVRCGASDIHINPDASELRVRFRIDGVLHERQGPPLALHAKIVQRLKVMAQLDLTQSRKPQDGKFRFTHQGRTVDARLSIVPTVVGENAVVRLLNAHTAVLSFADLGLDAATIADLETILAQPHGMLLVTGPTGSGKTTTLYTAIAHLNTPEVNIVTIEDPVEIRLPLVRQVQVNPDVGLTFAGALRSVLRQDPDIVLVGEIRDEETASIALQAALTGHFVLSTLHTNDAAGAVARLADFGLPPFVINSAVSGVVAQRLVRRVCTGCAAPDAPDPRLLERFEIETGAGSGAATLGFKRGSGCPRCMQTGYHGRVGVYELLGFTPALQDAVAAGASTSEIRAASVREGSRLMWQDGVAKARQGLTTLDEVARMVSVIETAAAQGRGSDAKTAAAARRAAA